jgi:hypothetical protein
MAYAASRGRAQQQRPTRGIDTPRWRPNDLRLEIAVWRTRRCSQHRAETSSIWKSASRRRSLWRDQPGGPAGLSSDRQALAHPPNKASPRDSYQSGFSGNVSMHSTRCQALRLVCSSCGPTHQAPHRGSVEDARACKTMIINTTQATTTVLQGWPSHTRFQPITRELASCRKCGLRAFKAAARVRIPLGIQDQIASDKAKRPALMWATSGTA